jgi:hypothetical protein
MPTTDPEKRRAKRRRYYELHRERILAAYRAAHPNPRPRGRPRIERPPKPPPPPKPTPEERFARMQERWRRQSLRRTAAYLYCKQMGLL